MNRYKLLILLMFVTFYVQAQPLSGKYILKGSSELTGQFFTKTYSSNSNSSLAQVETSQFNFQPSIGVFISHYIYLGIYTGYNYHKVSDSNNYNKSTEFTIGPSVRGYIGDFKFAPFLQGNFGYSSNRLEQQDDNNDDLNLKLDGINYGIGVGIEYFIERKFSFEFSFNYTGTKVSEVVKTNDFYGGSSNAININTKGFGFRIGTSIFLN